MNEMIDKSNAIAILITDNWFEDGRCQEEYFDTITMNKPIILFVIPECTKNKEFLNEFFKKANILKMVFLEEKDWSKVMINEINSIFKCKRFDITND